MMQAVKRLKEYGYTFALHDGKIKYKFMGPGKPEESKVKPLLIQIRENKAAAMSYLVAGQATHSVSPINNIRYLPQVEQAAQELIQGIKQQALAVGWTEKQLERLSQMLKVFLPCRIGTIMLQAIEIQTLYKDGKCRGSLHFYNDLIEQPWTKPVEAGHG